MIVVGDAGPLIALAKIEGLHLLRALYRQVITGPTVYTEAVTAGLALGADDAAVLERAYQEGWLVVQTPSLTSLPQGALLHAGEAESMQLAIELKAAWLLVDDYDARQVAQQAFEALGLKIAIKGTLGIIVTATQSQIITSKEAIEGLKRLKDRPDIWIAPALCQAVIETLQQMGS